MERKREPELMVEDAQARAYAEADFNDPHGGYVTLFKEAFGDRGISGYVLDLGCGPGDITFRFARAFPGCTVHGVDGSEAMLGFGWRQLTASPELQGNVELFTGMVPGAELPRERYDAIISNSLLHHLPRPAVLWDEVKLRGKPGAPVFIMDLRRPGSREYARLLVDRHAGSEPEILRRDFYNSLLAAFRVEEVHKQLEKAGLDAFTVKETGDRHLIISGLLP
ncbi:MAG TPA: methyltransferase domain-containing protein [Actinobacteria bacterium]|nr:methyltransferase domain-containing protein [Actinomycetota bacterium]